MSNVPKLRFRGFNDEWINRKLGDLLEFKNGINADKEAYGKGVKFINVLDILRNNYITANKIIGRVDIDEDTLKKYSVHYGDIVFQRSSETREEVGTANVYLDDETVTFGGFVIRGKKIGDYEPAFMNSLLKSNSARKEITTKAGGSTRYNVGQEILSEVNLKFPSIEEQEKIANFLTKVDKLIENQYEKVKSLEQYKKGIMQKIFSQELRFKKDDGEEYQEWGTKTIEDIASIEKGFTPDTNNELLWQGDIKWLSISGMNSKYILEGNKNISIEALGKKKLVKENTLIMSFKLTIGRLAIVKSPLVTNEAICHFYWKDKNINTEYMYYYLNYVNIESFGCRAAKGITLNNESLNAIIVKIPCLEEQNKIANFLYKIDSIIEKEREKLEYLREWKKGLLQGMFL